MKALCYLFIWVCKSTSNFVSEVDLRVNCLEEKLGLNEKCLRAEGIIIVAGLSQIRIGTHLSVRTSPRRGSAEEHYPDLGSHPLQYSLLDLLCHSSGSFF